MSKLGTNPTPKMNFYPEYVPATRPAAPVEGLETVGYVTTSPTGAEVFQRKPLVPGHGQFGYKQDAVVTRSQADELLAAERAETMRQVKHWSELYKQQHYRAEKAEAIIAAERAEKEKADKRVEFLLKQISRAADDRKAIEADNAALTARVKELGTANAKLCDDVIDYELKVAERDVSLKALETQLASRAAQYKDLEDYAREATKAITGLTGGGSENFSKQIGELFTADLPLCLERIRERYVSKVEVKRLEKKMATAKKALEGIAQLELGATGMTFGDQVLALTSARAALEASHDPH